MAMLVSVVTISACSSKQNSPNTNSAGVNYVVTVNQDDNRKIFVEANLQLVNDTLRMSQVMAEGAEDGYAGFVHDLQATDDKGNTVNVNKAGRNTWKVSKQVPALIHLRYYVQVGHDAVNWPVSGAFARAYATDKLVFFTGRTVFIAAQGNDSLKLLVKFNLPQNWQVITPYKEVPGQVNTFTADNLGYLWANGNMVGSCATKEIKIDELRVVFAGSDDMQESVDLMGNSLSKIVRGYSSALGGAPKGKLVILGSVASLMPGGETFNNSISMVFNSPPSMANKARWGYLIAHEAFHLWNGHTIEPADQPTVEWFVEGFTDYMSKLYAYRTGFTNQQDLFDQFAYSYGSYVASAGRVSLIDAGQDKGGNYSFIYGGGLTAAMALDIQCREATNNKAGFGEIMRRMYTDFGTTGKPYTYADIIKVCCEVAGKDLSSFFKDYVEGTKVIPLAEYCAKAGLVFANGQITQNPGISAAQAALLEGVLEK